MQYLKLLSRGLLAVVGLSFSLVAWADGTNSGTPVTNGVTIDFTVAAVPQSATTDVTFLVDRKLRLDVGTPNTNWVNAVAGQASTTGSSIQFTVENNSNDGVDVVVALIDQSALDVDGFDAVGPALAPTGLTIWEDTNGDGVLDGGENVLGTTAGVFVIPAGFAEDELRTISVSVDVDATATANLYQTYTLVAAVANAGVFIPNDSSSNESPGIADVTAVQNLPNVVDVVFADPAGAFPEDQGYNFDADAPTAVIDGLSDGQAANASGFRTVGVLGIAKFVEVLWDPITGNQYTGVGDATTGNQPKSIPGAVIMYVIGVTNQSLLSATGVAISDNVPGGQPGDPLQLGNAAAVASIELPDTVSITIDGSPVIFDLDNTNIAVDTNVYVRTCSTTAADPVSPTTGIPFDADPAEVNGVSMGASCDTNATGYIVYFATVDNTAS